MHYNMSYPKEKTAATFLPKSNHAVPRPKVRSQKGSPLDPEDLTRRLYIVLAEQKAYAEKKLRAREKAEAKAQHARAKEAKRSKEDRSHKHKSELKTAESRASGRNNGEMGGDKLHGTATDGSNGKQGEDGDMATYRHVPQVAASQFARTTTVESLSEITLTHKLSKKAIRFHKDGPNVEMAAVDPTMAPNEQAKALKRARSQREKQYERNQFQHPALLEASAEIDEKQLPKDPRHLFEAHLKTKGVDPEDEKDAKRMSTGSMLATNEATRQSIEAGSHLRPVTSQDSTDVRDAVHLEEHRVDWTQSDETGQPRPAEVPGLRKSESKWTLRGRLGSFGKHGKDEKGLPSLAEGFASESPPKSPKSGFFSRFKR